MSNARAIRPHPLRLRPSRRRRRRRSSAGSRSPPAGSTPTASTHGTDAAALAAPVADRRAPKKATATVNQIYTQRRPGRRLHPGAAEADAGNQPVRPPSENSGGGTATGSGFVIDTEGHIAHQRPRRRRRRQDRSQARRLRQGPTRPKVVGTDPSTDVALLKVDAPADQLHPLAARRLLEGRSRRPGGRDRQPVRPRPHRHQRHRLRPAAPDPGAQRLLDLAT